MPANASQPTLAAPVAINAPTETAVARPAPAADAKPVAKSRGDRLALLAYLLLIFGTVIAINLPRFRLKAGLGEEALVILSITSMLLGAGLALWSIIRSNLRQY